MYIFYLIRIAIIFFDNVIKFRKQNNYFVCKIII